MVTMLKVLILLKLVKMSRLIMETMLKVMILLKLVKMSIQKRLLKMLISKILVKTFTHQRLHKMLMKLTMIKISILEGLLKTKKFPERHFFLEWPSGRVAEFFFSYKK